MNSFKDHLKEACDCWKGHKRVPGTKPCAPGSCVKEEKTHQKAFDLLEQTAKAIDSGEYDYEGQMARTQLQTIYRNSKDLVDMLSNDENMPEWVQSKITLAQDYISSVRDYLQSREELGEENVTEGERGLWDNIHAKRKRIKAGSGEKMRKPGSKGAPTDSALKASQNEETIHVGHRNSKGDWIKTSTHSNYPDAKKAMADLEKQGKKGVQHRYDNAGSIDPGMRKLSHEELSADEQFDLIEELVTDLAEEHSIDPEIVWEKLESIDDDTLFEVAIDAKGHKSSTGGLTQKGVDAYNAKTGGNLKMAVTTPPSKLKAGSKAANRRKSFCARMSGVEGPMKDEKGRPTRKALALRKWNC